MGNTAGALQSQAAESHAAAFEEVFNQNGWRNAESVSGPGSTLHATRFLRKELNLFLAQLNVRSLLDIPCGDFHWMKQVPLDGIHYIGADIVTALVERNRQNIKCPNIEFATLDICYDPLPKVDLVLCRDCLVHLPFELILKALDNLKRSGSRWLLTTHFSWGSHGRNRDIQAGQWRPLNLTKAPFYLKIEDALIEGCAAEGYQDKSLALIDLHRI